MADTEQIWRSVPPEEKLELLAKSNARGVCWGFAVMLVGGTLGIAFQQEFVFWASILASPIAIQFAATRRWRFLRPKTVLEYLAARSVARRYAYAVKGNDLELKLIFRGVVRHLRDENNPISAIEAAIGKEEEVEVWIALFGDSVVLLSEQRGGADLEFGHIINHRFQVEWTSDDEREYSSSMRVRLHYEDSRLGKHSVEITSDYPAALHVFAKKVKEYVDTPRGPRLDLDKPGVPDLAEEAQALTSSLQPLLNN